MLIDKNSIIKFIEGEVWTIRSVGICLTYQLIASHTLQPKEGNEGVYKQEDIEYYRINQKRKDIKQSKMQQKRPLGVDHIIEIDDPIKNKNLILYNT